jgi:hypothetical protein
MPRVRNQLGTHCSKPACLNLRPRQVQLRPYASLQRARKQLYYARLRGIQAVCRQDRLQPTLHRPRAALPLASRVIWAICPSPQRLASAKRCTDESHRLPQRTSHALQIVGIGGKCIITVLRPSTFTMTTRIIGDDTEAVLGEKRSGLAPAVTGLATTMEHDHGRPLCFAELCRRKTVSTAPFEPALLRMDERWHPGCFQTMPEIAD